MTSLDNPLAEAAADAGPAGDTDRTIRIEHDRRRLALAALASGVATLALPGVLIAGMWHPARAAPAWSFAPLGLAILLAALGFVRSIIRLQDGDPALVISPRGLNFRPYLFREIVRIPWNAVRGFKSRRYKQQRFIAVQVDDIDRYAPRAGFPGFLRRLGERRLAADEIGFSTPMARSAWTDIETTLQRYLARYGRPPATDGDANHGAPRDGIAGRGARSLHSGSTP
ncbi:MAG TPA: STM3941 family protein [Rudaea sp.]|nr:STM3941 family protein [Rudaea sp.]